MNPLPATLRLLSEALDLLADCIEKQKFVDIEAESKELAVLVQRLRKKSGVGVEAIVGTPLISKRNNGCLLAWLQKRGITVTSYQSDLRADAYLHRAAEYLVDNFNMLYDFYKAFKYGQGQQKNFTFKTNAQSAKYIHQWCKMLHDSKFIDRYEKLANGDLYIDVSSLHEAIIFINGYWLEIILRGTIASYLQKNKDIVESYDMLSGVKIVKQDGMPSELDMLLYVNGKVFWFECKSGQIGEYYEIFNMHRSLLGLNREQCGIIITQPNANLEQNIANRSGMSTFDALHMNKLERFIFTNKMELHNNRS